MVEFRNVCKILVRKHGGKRCPGSCSWQCNFKMGFSWKDVDSSHLLHDEVQLWTDVTTVMNLKVL